MTTATPPRAPQDTQDTRRITERHPDYVRLHAATVRKLLANARRLARALRRGETPPTVAQSRFLTDGVAILADAYVAGHAAGQRHYWQAVSLRRHTPVAPDSQQLRRRVAFYAPSLAKMAHEATLAAGALPRAHHLAEHGTEARQLADDPLATWLAGIDNRVTLQGQVTWPGMQDGYVDAGASDPAGPYQYLFWDLEPSAQHCGDCPDVAAGSPYDPPGSGGNELQQTPGDGQTECGAACKCSLRYGSALEAGATRWWNDFFARMSATGMRMGPAMQLDLPPAPQAMNETQQRALDLYRAMTLAWDEWRGELPSMPHIFDEQAVVDWTQTLPADWSALTPKQRALLQQTWEALLLWYEGSQMGAGGE
jgi:hypothetical protein